MRIASVDDVLNGLVYHLHDDVVAHEGSAIHDAFDALAEFGLVGNFFAQQIARRDMIQFIFSHEEVALRAFASTGSTKKNDI